MKKLLIVLLALTVIGVFAFAQDAMAAPKPIGTYGQWSTGSLSLYESINGGSASTAWNNAWGATGATSGIDQEWGFGYAGNNYGYTSRFVFEASTDALGLLPGLASFDAYYNLNKYVQIAIGAPRGGEYRGFGTLADGFNNGAFFCNSKPGAELNLTPIDALALSAFFTAPFGTGAVPVTYADNLAFGAQYTMTGLFSVKAMYQGKNVNGSTGSYFHASVQVTPVKDLSITADADLPQASGANDTFSASAGYALMGGALNVQGDFGYVTTVASIGFEANIGYNIGTYTVGARVGYQDGLAGGVQMFGSSMSDINTTGGGNGVLVYPYAKANFDNGSFVQIGVSYQSGAGPVNQSKLDIPLYYGWSF